MTTTTLDLADIRANAARILTSGGWIQGDYMSTSAQPGCCIVEAICRGAGLPPATLARKKAPSASSPEIVSAFRAAQDLMDELSQQLGRDPERAKFTPRDWLTNWNDTKGRTLDEVLAALGAEAGQ